MKYIAFVGIWAVLLLHGAAALSGCIYLIGPILGTALFVMLLVLRFTPVFLITAFIGAWAKWKWPWYAALFAAMPFVLVMFPAFLAAAGAGALARFPGRGPQDRQP